MATQVTFDNMLNDYLTYDLLVNEFLKRDYVFSKVEKDNGWKGGPLIVPFEGAVASSIEFGGLAASNDVSEDKFIRGEVSTYKEVWGTMLFNHKDLMQNDRISEQSFLRILPDRVERFMDQMKMVSSVNVLSGPHFATVTDATNAATGLMIVDRPDRFEIGQKCVLDDGDSAPLTVYVIAIDNNARSSVTALDGTITVSLTRGGAAADVSAYSVAQAAKFYHPGILVGGVATNQFTSLRSSMLSSANGGSSTLYGQSKLAYPYLQSINVSGAAITAANILDKIFDAFVITRQLGKGNPTEVIVSYKHGGSILKLLETNKGAFTVISPTEASVYGWTEITIGGVKGNLKVVMIQEMDDDIIMLMDWRAAKFHSNGLFRKRVAPDGKHYFEVRSTSGYQYLVDMCLFGDLILNKPAQCGIIYSISY